ncbi:PIN domain-containing protein [Mucilaginibacter arboris]|uniref:PIN domain-containing protein n=1 Tax=Mucilaginibacter arboris TaxID=2682090 RepID=A0A7K1SSU6_9SPHI|nr:PIN domain-containing protein [Mucilaginibacter arboris]MVN20170.1 PIN domain-containing protein [Mucilaginibacter arboris]
MSGNKVFLDTNTCIYLLNGNKILADFLQGQEIFISIISEIELFAYKGNDSNSTEILNNFIQSIDVIDLDQTIKSITIEIRKTFRLKLPDSIIAASAISNNLPFITADKAFTTVKELDLILFEI